MALTGKGHATDKACVLGLHGEKPESIDPEKGEALVKHIQKTEDMALLNQRHIRFSWEHDLIFHDDQFLIEHPNGMTFTAKSEQKDVVLRQLFSPWVAVLSWPKMKKMPSIPILRRPIILKLAMNFRSL